MTNDEMKRLLGLMKGKFPNAPGFAEKAAQAGLGVNLWTVNDPETMAECLKYGVGIITNYPDVAVALRASHK